MGRPRALSSQLALLVLEDIALGDRITPVARRYGLSPSTVRRLIRQHGIGPRAPGRPSLWALWPDGERTAIVAEYLSGRTLVDIARERDLSPMTVARLVDDATRHMAEASEARDALIARLHFERGLSITRLCRLFRLGHERVRAILDAHRPPDAPPAPRRPPVASKEPRLTDQEALRLADAYGQGHTVSDICRRFGVSVGTLYRALHRVERLLGLPKNHIVAARCTRPFTCTHPIAHHAALYAEVAHELAEGTATAAQIARRYGAPTRAVRQRLAAARAL